MATDLVPVSLVREIVKASVARALAGTRIPKILTGTIEDLDAETLDVAYVRMDGEAMGSDPTQSDNWGAPGVIPATRLGDTVLGEQVRVTFDGVAGASAMRTAGPGTGQRMVVDATSGEITFYDANDQPVGFLDATRWELGTLGESLARLDPLGGLRLRDENDVLRVQLSAPEGLILRHAEAGVSGLIAGDDGLIVIDPVTGDRISITSGTSSAMPTPHWVSSQALSPGASHSTPAISSFGTGDDLDLRFVAASAAADLGAQSYTPPATYTERSDVNGSGNGITLATSSASLDPAVASPAVASFTNTSSAWTRRNGHSVIVRGGGGTSPAFRSAATTAVLESSAASFGFDIDLPAGTVEGDLMVAFVAIASSKIPVGWVPPPGWKQLGVQVAIGAGHILASGVWYKPAGPAEPSTFHVAINMSSAGFTKVQATGHAISNPYAFPGGLDIRRNNRSMPRGLVGEFTSESNSAAFADTALPVTVDQISGGVPVLAGRSYEISYQVPIYEFATLHANNAVSVAIQLDTGTGFANFHRTQMRTAVGSTRNGLTMFRTYVPVADVTLGVRTQIQNANNTAGYTLQLFGGADIRRHLKVEDLGAAF